MLHSSEVHRQIRAEWEAAAPEWGRQDLWSQVERSAQSLNDHLVDLARLGPGGRVLDVGTGIGEPAVTAARRVGPTGYVLGVDLAEGMILEGRKRVERLGLDGIVELRHGNAESLELADATFDAVVSRWALMLAGDFQATLAGLGRCLTPGGRLAVALWGHVERVPFIRLALEAALDLLGRRPPEDGPQHFWTRGCQTLERLARNAGFTDVRVEALDVAFEFPSPERYADFISRMAGPVKVLTDRQEPRFRKRLLAGIAQRSEPFRQLDGSVRLPAENLILHGMRPPA